MVQSKQLTEVNVELVSEFYCGYEIAIRGRPTNISGSGYSMSSIANEVIFLEVSINHKFFNTSFDLSAVLSLTLDNILLFGTILLYIIIKIV
jgi:hypothetical protein